MKIRSGFVSNSSSSSFIVKHIDRFLVRSRGIKNNKGALDKTDIKKLEKHGFKVTSLTHPSHLENAKEDETTWTPFYHEGKIISKNYGLHVSCNEMEVIQFLIKNNIGFIASGHYGHVHYLFNKGDKHLMVFRNYGMEVETYHQNESWEKILKEWNLYSGGEERPYYRIPITKKFLEQI